MSKRTIRKQRHHAAPLPTGKERVQAGQAGHSAIADWLSTLPWRLTPSHDELSSSEEAKPTTKTDTTATDEVVVGDEVAPSAG